MAWSFRRRKTILPGVHINIGKKGVSTTIGPRGASMTFGPNGTYLNTSIPGTGLYNRKKIEGTNITSSNSNMNTENLSVNVPPKSITAFGCVTAMLLLIGIVFSITFIILVINDGFDAILRKWAYITWIITLMLGLSLIISRLIYKERLKQFEEQRKETERLKRIEAERLAKLPNYGDIIITEKYFNEVKVLCTNFSDICAHILIHKPNILQGIEDNKLTSDGVTSIDVFHSMILSDVYCSFCQMQCSQDIKSREGLGRLILASTLNTTTDLKFETLRNLTDNIFQLSDNMCVDAYKIFGSQENLVVPNYLKVYDEDICLQYLVCLYRFLSLTAKADDVVTDEESNYLSSILAQAKEIHGAVKVDKDYLLDTQLKIDLFLQLGWNLDTIDVGNYVIQKQKCVLSDIQAELHISRDRVLRAIKDLERITIIKTEGKTRKVMVSHVSDMIALFRGEPMDLRHYNSASKNNEEERKSTIIEVVSEQPKKRESKKQNVKHSPTELDSLIGLISVKKEINTLTNFIKIQQKRQEQGMKTPAVSYHCVFTGNPGTGKTTVARIVAGIYKDLGILQRGHLVETDRAGLVAEYVGQTAVKTNKIIDSALDGVLFIDEAYSLVSDSSNDYGKEAIATLLKRMEDDRDRLIVILAGYTNEMKDFIDTNPGLQSRFNRYIEFPDYSAEELLQIYESNLKKFDYKITNEAKDALARFFENAVANKDKNFGNARFVRNIFEKTLEKQANRLASQSMLTNDILTQIVKEDLP